MRFLQRANPVVSEKYQNSFQHQELSEVTETTEVNNRYASKIVKVCLKDLAFASASLLLYPAKLNYDKESKGKNSYART